MSNRLNLIKPYALTLLRKNEYVKHLRNEGNELDAIQEASRHTAKKYGVPYPEVLPIVKKALKEVKLAELLEI